MTVNMINVQEICPEKLCTGCLACANVCTHEAIVVEERMGFYYPRVNEDKCVGCTACQSVCPVVNKKGIFGNTNEDKSSCLAAWNNNDSVRSHSSSGGIFSAIAKLIIDYGGVVFGAAWDENLVLRHIGISEQNELDKLRRSKYVQSEVGLSYSEVKRFLEAGRWVLFSGTPCQLAGLTHFLVKDYPRLIKMDVLCQGVSSPVLFRKYVENIEIQKKIKITNAVFRVKNRGWWCSRFLLRLEDINGKRIYRFLDNNEYYNAYFKEYYMRQSCYQCRFKSNDLGYYSDITVADFWRIGDKVPFKYKGRNKGVSAVIVNSLKGQSIVEAITGEVTFVEREWTEFASNGGLRTSIVPENNSRAFEDVYRGSSWRANQQAYYPIGKKERIKVLCMLVLGETCYRFVLKIFRRIKALLWRRRK